MVGGVFVLLLWGTSLVFTIWVVLTLLRVLNRIAIALERLAGIPHPPYARTIAPGRL